MSLNLSSSFNKDSRISNFIDFTLTTSSSNLNSTLEDKLRSNNKISNSTKPQNLNSECFSSPCKIKPKAKKFYLEDKISEEKLEFSLFKEEDLKFFKNKVIRSHKEKKYVSL